MPRITDNPKQKIVSFRTEDHVMAVLRDEARKQGSTLTHIVRQAFEDWITQHAPVVARKARRKQSRRTANSAAQASSRQ